jgi:hypothetical protein
MIYTPHQILFRGPNKENLDGRGRWHVGGKDRSVGGLRRLWGNNIKVEIEELGGEAWTGLI